MFSKITTNQYLDNYTSVKLATICSHSALQIFMPSDDGEVSKRLGRFSLLCLPGIALLGIIAGVNQPTPTTTGPRRNLVLIGFMGTGKTCIGKLAARSLGWPVLSP